MAEASGADAESPGAVTKLVGERRVQFNVSLLDAGTIALCVDESEGSGWFVEVAQHGAEEVLVVAVGDAQPCLSDEVAEG